MPKPVSYSYQATTYNLMPSFPTERVRIKWRESLMLNKFLFTTLEIFSCMEPFQTNLSECNRHRFYFPPESKYLLYLQPSLLRSLQKQFPHSAFQNSIGSLCQHWGDIVLHAWDKQLFCSFCFEQQCAVLHYTKTLYRKSEGAWKTSGCQWGERVK